MPVTEWYPYAPDQQFGVRFVAQEERIDRFLAALAGSDPDQPAGPVTTATALEAAVEIGRGRD